MNTISATQQTAFENMVTNVATVKNLTRQQAIILLVETLGGGAEAIAPNWERLYA